MIEALTMELHLPRHSLGSTTLKNQLKKRGVEPDKCYYFANATALRGKSNLDFSKLPPPDLAIEIDISHSSIDKLGLYAAIGVPELWFYDGETIRVHLFQENGSYLQNEKSAAFPFLDFAKLSISFKNSSMVMKPIGFCGSRNGFANQYGHLAQ